MRRACEAVTQLALPLLSSPPSSPILNSLTASPSKTTLSSLPKYHSSSCQLWGYPAAPVATHAPAAYLQHLTCYFLPHGTSPLLNFLPPEPPTPTSAVVFFKVWESEQQQTDTRLVLQRNLSSKQYRSGSYQKLIRRTVGGIPDLRAVM